MRRVPLFQLGVPPEYISAPSDSAVPRRNLATHGNHASHDGQEKDRRAEHGALTADAGREVSRDEVAREDMVTAAGVPVAVAVAVAVDVVDPFADPNAGKVDECVLDEVAASRIGLEMGTEGGEWGGLELRPCCEGAAEENVKLVAMGKTASGTVLDGSPGRSVVDQAGGASVDRPNFDASFVAAGERETLSVDHCAVADAAADTTSGPVTTSAAPSTDQLSPTAQLPAEGHAAHKNSFTQEEAALEREETTRALLPPTSPVYAAASREFERLGDCTTPREMLEVVKAGMTTLAEDAARISVRQGGWGGCYYGCRCGDG